RFPVTRPRFRGHFCTRLQSTIQSVRIRFWAPGHEPKERDEVRHMTDAVKPRGRRLRWWVLGIILVLGAVSVACVWAIEDVEPAFRIPMTLMLLAATGMLLVVWLTFLSGLRWRTRMVGVAGPILLVVFGLLIIRVEGCSGDMVPQLDWRWSPVRDRILPELAPEGGHVDLRTASPYDFPRFLGPEGRAGFRGVSLARNWSEQPPRQRWRPPIGAGWSPFPVVWSLAGPQEQR